MSRNTATGEDSAAVPKAILNRGSESRDPISPGAAPPEASTRIPMDGPKKALAKAGMTCRAINAYDTRQESCQTVGAMSVGAATPLL
jgi:hypothetical protein